MTYERTQPTPLVTADTALFSFYDIESLSNAFTMCSYTPHAGDRLDDLEVYFLLDDDELVAQTDYNDIVRKIRAENPGLPKVSVTFYDLRTPEGNLQLAKVLGLSDAQQVCHKTSNSSYPAMLRPVCDTDADYDHTVHPFLVGYNSFNYDTTMLAIYLSEAFSDLADYGTRVHGTRQQIDKARSGQNYADAQQRLRDLQKQGTAFVPLTARAMRVHNDKLFTEEYIDYMPGVLGWDAPAAKIRRAMLGSGRHIDAARLNESQKMVGLKRLLGMLGYQIKESDQLSHNTVITSLEQFYELLAYNVSDCLGLSQLFTHPTYSSAFDLKAGLMAQYSETVYTKSGAIRNDRLAIDASSAKFVGRILSPFGSLQDIEAVSFMYPHPEVARERGIESVNVLDECVRFFEETVTPDRDTNPDQADAHRRFMEVVGYYRDIQGKNFNDSDEYEEIFTLPVNELGAIPKRPNNVPYFHSDGTASSCFATFSYGGIHGAEINRPVLDADAKAHKAQSEMLQLAQLVFPEATDLVAESRRQRDLMTLPDGSTVDKSQVIHGKKYRKAKKGDTVQNEQLARAQAQVEDPEELIATLRPAEQALNVIIDHPIVGRIFLDGKAILANATLVSATYKEAPTKKLVELFPLTDPEGTKGPVDRSTKLHPKFNYTSAGLVIHEDFTSYYPNLLRNMRAFYNPDLGEDRYEKIFFDKQRYGKEMKQPGISEKERTRLDTLRNGTKLILNSASGAGDAGHKSPIRMNNQIISMRIIGQLFSWRIGQAQTLAGGRIISTNTDGLYSIIDEAAGFTTEVNNQVLAEQETEIGVEIEPEPLFLISKDSNNRLELTAPGPGQSLEDSTIIAAGGGTLACHGGPRPDKSLAHPAVIDWALARYLQTVAGRGEHALLDPFDPDLGKKIIDEALDPEDLVRTAMLFQNVVAASRGSITYPFAADPIGAGEETVIVNPRALQMINRVFIVREGTEGAVSLHNAGAWKVPPASQARRREDPDANDVERDEIAKEMLRSHGWAADRYSAGQQGLNLIPEDQDVVTRKINSIDTSWSMLIRNDDLHMIDPAVLRELLDSVDLDVYVGMLGETFTKNWRNKS